MAVSAKFVADFTSFTSAVSQAETKLRSFESGAASVEKQLSRMGDSFSGRRVLQEATLAAKAVEDIGGVSKLTGTELERVGTLAREAAAKMTAMGHDVPPKIRDLVNATTPLPEKLTLSAKAADLAKSSFGQMFGAFTAVNLITGAVTGIINLGKSAFESASKTADLSAKLGIGTEAIQRMDHVAKQTGSTVDQFASAAFKLGTRLSGNSDSVKEGVDALGLSLLSLRGLRPEQQFEAVVVALGKMDDATKRNEIGVALFGKSFETIAAGVAADYSKVASGASVSSDAQIQALARAGDAWDAYKQRASASMRGLLGNVVQNVEAIREVISERGIFSSTFGVLDEARRRVQLGLLGGRAGDVGLSAANAGGAAANENYVASLRKAEAAVGALKKEQREQLDAALKLGKSEEELADRFGISEEVLRLYTGQVKEHKKDTVEATRAAQEFKKGQDALFGLDIIAKAKEAAKQVEKIGFVSLLAKDKQAELYKVMSDAIDVQRRLGLQVDATFTQIRNAIKPTEDLRLELRKLETVVEETTVDLKALGRIPPPLEAMRTDLYALETAFKTTGIDGLLTNLGEDLKKIGDIGDKPLSAFQKKFEQTFRGTIQDIPRIIEAAFTGGGGFKGAMEAIGASVGADIGRSIGKSIGGELGGEVGASVGSLLGKGIVKGITSDKGWVRALTGFAVAGPLGAIGAALFGGRGPSQMELEGRAAIQAIEKELTKNLTALQRAEAGGMRWKETVIAVRDAYLATGRSAADAERDVKALWDSSVKGADAANEAAQKLNDALAEQQADMERLDAAIQKYGFSIEELGPAMRAQQLNEQAKELIEDWRVLVASGIDLALVNERMSEAMADYIGMAARTGTEVPAAMKPILESLIAQGQLRRDLSKEEEEALEKSKKRIEEIGELLKKAQSDDVTQQLNDELAKQRDRVAELTKPYKDLEEAGITFAETMTQGFDRVVLKLEELILKLQGAGVAIGNIPKTIDVGVNYTPRFADESIWDRLTNGRGQSFHQGGVVDFAGWKRAHRGLAVDEVPIVAQTGEGVLSRQGMSNLGKLNSGQGLSRVPITVVLELDGRVLGRATAEYLPGALATMGVRVA